MVNRPWARKGRRTNGGGKKGNGQGGARARADRQLAQGTGRAVAKPFLSAPKAMSWRGWDAFDPYHLPLPRATGPYAVVRTSRLIETTAKYIQFGTFRNAGNNDPWSNVVMIEDVVSSTAVNESANTRKYTIPVPGGSMTGTTLSVVPAALSVQIMNPEALQGTNGIIAGAVCHTQLDINERTETYDELCTEIISYFRPRLMSAAKLALRGVQANSYPLNMSSIADFKPVVPTVDGTVTMGGAAIHPEGWAPIVCVNDGGVDLRFLVSVEWRVRFDMGNPAVASHAHHGVTSDSTWENCIKQAVSVGNGMLDIAEKVATVGQAVAPYFQKMPKAVV